MTTTSKGTSASGGQLSLDEYDRIVSSIHEGAMDTEGLYEALETLRTSLDANYVTLILRISDVDDFALMLVAGNQAVRGRVAYFKHLQQDDPFVGQIPDTVFSIDSILSAEAWQSSRYYREYARPSDVYHVMGADITAMEAGMVRFRLTVGTTSQRSRSRIVRCACGCCRTCGAVCACTTCLIAVNQLVICTLKLSSACR